MSLRALTVENLRCIERAELELHPGRNLIWGGNGSGKTSLLEAIFLLGRGRSFRTRSSERLVRHGAERLVVFGRMGDEPERTVGVEVDRHHGTHARANGGAVASLAELSLIFPVQVIDPEIHKLIEEGGRRRRRWLDWAVFHVEPRFGDWWLRYARALRQRNAALRHPPGETASWDRELAELGRQLSEARRAVIERVGPHWHELAAALDCPGAELHYFQGWSGQLDLEAALEASRARDQARGVTHCGPHRADVQIRVAGRPARDVLSRGQQKLMAVALILAQLKLLRESSEAVPTLLLDDPAAELDSTHLRYFADQIGQFSCQLAITSLVPDAVAFGVPDRLFHVEQGGVRPV